METPEPRLIGYDASSARCHDSGLGEMRSMINEAQPLDKAVESTVLNRIVREMLKEKNLPDEALSWILEDISPRLMFLDGRFPQDILLAPGASHVFAAAMRKALQEILRLEIELYYERYGR